MKTLLQTLMLTTLVTACVSPTSQSPVTTGVNIKPLIENQQFCTISSFDTDVHSTFSAFNGNDGSFTLNVAGTDAGTLSGTLSGDLFTITSGSITQMGMTVSVTGGSLDFSDDGQSAVGNMEVDVMGEMLDISLKLNAGACNFETLAYASPLPANIITTNYLDLVNITSISKFRSAAGHDFVDEFETCRSMKHYYNFDGALSAAVKATIPYFSPVDGEITSISRESSGDTIHIQPTAAPYLYVEIFHLDLDPSLTVGSAVTSGSQIGTHFSYGIDGGNSDIAVWIRRPDGYRLISQFEIMSGAVLAEFTARGVSDWTTDLYFSDSAPHLGGIVCDGQDFTAGTDVARDYFPLN